MKTPTIESLRERFKSILKDEESKEVAGGKFCRDFARRQWRKSFGDGMFRYRDKMGPAFRRYVRT